MGNCIRITSKHTPQTPSKQIRSHIEQNKESEAQKNGKMRVKIVLRKEELELLMLELKKTGGKRPLEDVLGDIQRSRAKSSAAWRPLEDVLGDIQRSRAKSSAAWRPCLDSILET